MNYNRDLDPIDDDQYEKQELNFAKGDNFYLMGEVDESFPKNIIAPFIELVQAKVKESNPTPIHIHISSWGGYCQYCFDLIAWILFAKSKGLVINTYCTSTAYSAASIIFCVGTNRYVTRRTQLLLHFARTSNSSHNPEMAQRNKEADDHLQDELIEVYKKHTKMKDIKKKLMTDNYYILGGQQLINLGFADEML